MVDDNPEDTTPSPDSGRARRTPPTIELEPSEVSGETRNAGEDVQAAGRHAAGAHVPGTCAGDFPLGHRGHVRRSRRFAGDLCGWMLGWPAVLPATSSAPPFNAAVVDDSRRACRRHRGQDQQACSGGARSRHGQSRRSAGEIPCLVAR